MRATSSERVRAERVAAAVDALIRDPEAEGLLLEGEDAALLGTARRLARLPGAVDPAVEERLLRVTRAQGEAREARSRRPVRLRPGWAVAGALIALLGVALLTPLGQTALASFMAVFNLGRTEVQISPAHTATASWATAEVRPTAVEESLTLAEAQTLPFAILEPAALPPGYALRRVTGYTYPDLPAWVPQPFSVELVYGDEKGHEMSLRLYPISLGEGNQLNVSRMNLEAAPIQEVKDVDLNGQPGVLLRLGKGTGKAVWQEVVWEQGNVLVSLSTSDLGEAELLEVARSVR